jgi:Uma2 family endonuclease
MIDTGVIGAESHVELIDGEIFMMLPLGPPQGSLIARLTKFFIRNLPSELDCRAQLPIVAGDQSEPEPDIAIVRGREDDYKHAHPVASDVALLVEVAHSSLAFDLGRKVRLYGSCGIAEYWVIDIENKSIHVHRSPTSNRYADVVVRSAGESVAPLAAPGCHLDIDWLFH